MSSRKQQHNGLLFTFMPVTPQQYNFQHISTVYGRNKVTKEISNIQFPYSAIFQIF